MGPVNWLAVVVGAALAALLGAAWYRRRGGIAALPLLAVALLIPASLIGHNFARIGPAVLAARPWLYPMMSGGFALTMIAPALAVGYRLRGLSWRDWAVDAAYWLLALLIVGSCFWALR